jgi:cytochrome c
MDSGRTITRWPTAMLLVAAATTACAAASAPPTTPPSASRPVPLTPAPNVPGNPDSGRGLFGASGCGGCHTLYGLPGATGVAGPNLTNVTLRPTLAGETLPMSPASLTAWLLDPAALKPGTLMPRLGLSQQEAADLTAFLYSQPYNVGR